MSHALTDGRGIRLDHFSFRANHLVFSFDYVKTKSIVFQQESLQSECYHVVEDEERRFDFGRYGSFLICGLTQESVISVPREADFEDVNVKPHSE